MLLFELIISFLVYSVQGNGEFLIFSSPPSAQFEGNQPIEQSDVSEVIAATIGFTTQKDSDWAGLSVVDPFNYGEAVAVVSIKGISSLGQSDKNVKSYPLSSEEDEAETWFAVKDPITDRFPVHNNTLVHIELGGLSDLPQELKTTALDRDVDEDRLFLEQLQELKQLVNKLRKQKPKLDGVPDLYWITMDGLHALSDVRGSNHAATLEAKQKTYNAIVELSDVLKSLYQGRVLVAALVSDMTHTRRSRAVEAADAKADDNNSTDWNLATEYSPAFPAIFNIILWFMVVFIISLIAISYFIATMDPGRDSIIYRMTSNRMKKDS